MTSSFRSSAGRTDFHVDPCEEWFYGVRDIVTDLPPAFERFYSDEDGSRTCTECGAVHPGKG